MDLQLTSIYVLPTEEDLPPRAVLFNPTEIVDLTPEGIVLAGTLSTWSRDMGTWTIEGVPIPQDLADRITEHAKSLGVEW